MYLPHGLEQDQLCVTGYQQQSSPAWASFLQGGSDRGGIQVFLSLLAATKGVKLYPINFPFSVQIATQLSQADGGPCSK